MMTMLYNNVTMARLNCMRRETRRMMRSYAARNGYVMTRMMFPPGNRATWYTMMSKNGMRKEMMMRVYRDPMTNKLMIQCSHDMMSDTEMRDMMDRIHRMC
ncbi:MAG: hypothetical protein ACM3PA_00385 [Methanomassiliicoccales archaeon]